MRNRFQVVAVVAVGIFCSFFVVACDCKKEKAVETPTAETSVETSSEVAEVDATATDEAVNK
ncbi:MAG: hypothetical protein LBU29_02905 [Endomicrobium sp.]|jgi:hypothetical protein|nr:hypothetical protein [Endomicrobium sp.]